MEFSLGKQWGEEEQLIFAIRNGSLNIIDAFLKKTIDINKYCYLDELLKNRYINSYEGIQLIKKLIEYGINTKFLLHKVCKLGYDNIVEFLVNKKFNVNEMNDDWEFPKKIVLNTIRDLTKKTKISSDNINLPNDLEELERNIRIYRILDDNGAKLGYIIGQVKIS
jgi:hypothetical protein